MSAIANATPQFDRDSNEAISHAMSEGDYRFLSDEVREKLLDWLRQQVTDAMASGPPIEADLDRIFDGVKRRGRERLRANGTP